MAGIGTELKINVRMEPIGNVHLKDCEFSCFFFVFANKGVTIKKNEMIEVDEDNYIALLDTSDLSVGDLKMVFEVDIPDGDFDDNYRKEIDTVCTGISITKIGVCR